MLIYRKVGRSKQKVCVAEERPHAGAPRTRGRGGSFGPRDVHHAGRREEEGQRAQAGVLRVLPLPHLASKLPEPQLHRVPQDTQEARQAVLHRQRGPVARREGRELPLFDQQGHQQADSGDGEPRDARARGREPRAGDEAAEGAAARGPALAVDHVQGRPLSRRLRRPALRRHNIGSVQGHGQLARRRAAVPRAVPGPPDGLLGRGQRVRLANVRQVYRVLLTAYIDEDLVGLPSPETVDVMTGEKLAS